MSTYQDAEGKTRSSLNVVQRMFRSIASHKVKYSSLLTLPQATLRSLDALPPALPPASKYVRQCYEPSSLC